MNALLGLTAPRRLSVVRPQGTAPELKFAAACFDVRGDGFEFVFTACAEDEFCAFSGEFEGGRLADAGGSAGDDDDFVGDVLHGYLLWVLDSEGRFTYTSSAQVYVNACGAAALFPAVFRTFCGVCGRA